MYFDVFLPTDNPIGMRGKKGYERMTYHVEDISQAIFLEWSGRDAWWHDIKFHSYMRGPQERDKNGLLAMCRTSLSSLKSLKITSSYDKSLPKHDLEMALLRGDTRSQSYMSDFYYIIGKSRHLTPYPKNLCLVDLVKWTRNDKDQYLAEIMRHGVVVDTSKGIEQLDHIGMKQDFSYAQNDETYVSRFERKLNRTTLHIGEPPNPITQGVWTSDLQHFPMS